MSFNRIQHFLYTNNIPQGLNYHTSILASTVYHEGAEYPYVPVLPQYVGYFRDSLTSTVSNVSNKDDTISNSCSEAFDNAYKTLELNLGALNARMKAALDKWVDDWYNCWTNWASEFGAIVGIDMIVDAMDFMTGEFVDEVATAGLPALLRSKIDNLKILMTREMDTNRVFNQRLQNSIDYYKEEIENITQQLNDGLYNSEQERQALVRLRVQLRQRIIEAQRLFRNVTSWSSWLKREIELVKMAVRDYMKQQQGAFSIVKNFAQKLPTMLAKFLDKLKILVTALGRIAPWIALGILLNSLNNLIDCFNKMCENYNKEIRSIEDVERPRVMQDYIDKMKEILDLGCCDKECPPCDGGSSGSSGNNNGSSGSGSGSGVGSSCTKGVGLNLLMGNKYIPTYYDQIDENYKNKTLDPQSGHCGFKPNCPPGNLNDPSGANRSNRPDCTKYKGANGWGYPPPPGMLPSPLDNDYLDNTWQGCKNTPIEYGVGNEVMIPNPKCSCGYQWMVTVTGEDPPKMPNPCDVGDLFGLIGSYLRKLPGVIDGVISSGGGIGV
jgi:hypothetical protein